MDASGSIEHRVLYDWTFTKSFIRDVITALPVGPNNVRVALVSFSDQANVHATLDQYSTKAEVIDALAEIQFIEGLTNIAEAFRITREIVFGSRNDVQDIMVFISDGEPTINIA